MLSVSASAPIEQVLDSLPESAQRLLILGPAGAGKSTLLRWCAIQAARSMLDGAEVFKSDSATAGPVSNKGRGSWRQQVPILIRLRECPAGTLPAANDLTRFLAKHLPSAPIDWMTGILDSGRALVLLDGVDEVHRDKRAQLAEEIGELIRTYPSCTYVVSTRAGAIEDGWLDRWNFTEAQVEPMSRRDRDEFIDRWYAAAALELKHHPRPGEDLSQTALRLRTQISDQPELGALATNPLLCAMICALYRERQERLPETSSELCEALCHMLVHRRERETLGLGDAHFDTTWRELHYAQKKSLLADLAWYMANAGESSIELSTANSLIAAGLASTPGRTAKEAPIVLQALVERSGVLRSSGDERVDFLHNALKEYLAAGFAVERGEWTLLAEHADDAGWQPIVLFALSLAGEPFNSALVAELLVRAQTPRTLKTTRTSGNLSKGEKHALQRTKAREFFLVRCRAAAKRLDASYSTAIDNIARRFLPPASMREVEAMAEIGERVLLYSTNNLSDPSWWEEQTALVALRCLRLLRRIGGRIARSIFMSIARLPSHSTLLYSEWIVAATELAQGGGSQWPFLERTHIDITGNQIQDLHPLVELQSLRKLEINHTYISDLSPLASLSSLESLRICDCPAVDITPLAELINLQSLSLIVTPVLCLPFLSRLNLLRVLNLSWTIITDIGPLEAMRSLEQLDLTNTRVSDLTPLARLTSLRKLNASRTQVSELLPLVDLTGLQGLELASTQITNLAPLAKLTSLERLNLAKTRVKDLLPLSKLHTLETLILDNTLVDNLEPLAELPSLKHLVLSNTSVMDLAPLTQTPLRSLSLAGTGGQGLQQLLGCASLCHLTIHKGSFSDRELFEFRERMPHLAVSITQWTTHE